MAVPPLDLEGADDLISLKQAASIAGKSPDVLRYHAHRGALRTVGTAQGMMTTRRWLAAYLTHPAVTQRGRRPSPADESAPE